MISEVSKRDIIDILIGGMQSNSFLYFGRLSEISFLNRLVNLTKLPSHDSRYNNMQEDVIQHTINNYDWGEHWVFEDSRLNLLGDEELFNKFIEEMFHPIVLDEKSDWIKVFNNINEVLKNDNIQLMKSETFQGRQLYKLTSIVEDRLISSYTEEIKQKFSSVYIDSQVEIMLENIEENPHVAIGKSKELIESCCKTILDELKVKYNKNIEFTPLYKSVLKELGLSAQKQNKETQSGLISAKILGNLSGISQSMAELRNAFGSGHGKTKTFVSLPPRYARLAVGTATSVVYFLWETYQERTSSF